jgi:predicted DNA-binding protein YlxM (UPF0122 family)
LGLTQADVIEQSKLPGYKLKQFETGRFVPDIPFLQNLHDFYQEKGIDLSEAETASTKTDAVADDVKSVEQMIRHVQRPCFYISDSVTPALLEQCLERMSANDERIAEILEQVNSQWHVRWISPRNCAGTSRAIRCNGRRLFDIPLASKAIQLLRQLKAISTLNRMLTCWGSFTQNRQSL